MNYIDLKGIFSNFSEEMTSNMEWLNELDKRIGDGDIGFTLAKGFSGVSKAINKSNQENLGQLLLLAGKKMSITVPCTIGTLLAFGFMNAGKKMSSKSEWTTLDFADFLKFLYEGIQTLGNAQINEKTILDSLYPLYTEFMNAAHSGDDFKEASRKAKVAAREGFLNTKNFIARHGKTAVYGKKTLSFEDPGAAAAMLLGEAIYKYFAAANNK